MKKNFFMLAATAALFAACAETELVNEVNVESNSQAIGFETFAQKATRAENSGEEYVENDLSNHHTAFNVWASKELAGTPSYVEVYNSGTVTHNGTVWTANPLKYWDKAALNYYFYAAAPTGIVWSYKQTDTDGSTGYFKLDNHTLYGTNANNLATGKETTLHRSWKGKEDKDLLIAAECVVPHDFYYNVTAEAVNLDFIHILSRLNIAVKTTENNVKVNKLDVVRLNNVGAFDESKVSNTDLINGTTGRWTVDAEKKYTLVAQLGGAELALVKDASAIYTHEYLVIPQKQKNSEATVNSGVAPTNDAYIYIEYTVGGELYKTHFGLAQVFGVAENGELAFNEGWQNTLTITISPDAIEFTGDVAAWDEYLNEPEVID